MKKLDEDDSALNSTASWQRRKQRDWQHQKPTAEKGCWTLHDVQTDELAESLIQTELTLRLGLEATWAAVVNRSGPQCDATKRWKSEKEHETVAVEVAYFVEGAEATVKLEESGASIDSTSHGPAPKRANKGWRIGGSIGSDTILLILYFDISLK